ncbi:hypothetical protein DFH06DRAFT_160800 [Mycena polygramma]|nr:hypothetical protein DFH06DRAFT_160800 [Mycena polygramma]
MSTTARKLDVAPKSLGRAYRYQYHQSRSRNSSSTRQNPRINRRKIPWAPPTIPRAPPRPPRLREGSQSARYQGGMFPRPQYWHIARRACLYRRLFAPLPSSMAAPTAVEAQPLSHVLAAFLGLSMRSRPIIIRSGKFNMRYAHSLRLILILCRIGGVVVLVTSYFRSSRPVSPRPRPLRRP